MFGGYTTIILLTATAGTPTGAQPAPPQPLQAPKSSWAVRSFEPTPARLVYTSARALGMLRGIAEEDEIVRIRYQGSGTGADAGGRMVPLGNYYVEISYARNAMRVDTTTSAGRRVEVVSGTRAWDELDLRPDGPPVGVAQTAKDSEVRMRRRQLAVTPIGAIKAAHANLAKARVRPLEHGTFELSFPHDGETMKITLDRNRRPAKVELGPLSAEYSNYKDYEPIDPQLSDEPLSDLFFPQRIVQRVNGKASLDVQIKTCWCVNPYVVF